MPADRAKPVSDLLRGFAQFPSALSFMGLGLVGLGIVIIVLVRVRPQRRVVLAVEAVEVTPLVASETYDDLSLPTS